MQKKNNPNIVQKLYLLAILLYGLAIRLGALFHPKAKAWAEGRKDWRKALGNWERGPGKVLWMHCASLGEFEQGRPIIERVRGEMPGVKVALTFFSPSGYEMRKNYPLADGVFYLPLDTPANARDFLEMLRPDMAVFVKYEFWYFFWKELKKRSIPMVLVSAVFRPGQVFFRPWGGIFREMLRMPEQIFVQDESSAKLLGQQGIKTALVAGDTRIDRVLAMAQEIKEWPALEDFCRDAKVFIAGSAWPPDERLLESWLRHPSSRQWKCIIAPHEIREESIRQMEQALDEPVIRFTRPEGQDLAGGRILILDTVGMLAFAYRYGKAAYIGGGFGKGIHNILEPMAQGLPVLFGPKHHKFREAGLLIHAGAAWAVGSADELIDRINFLSQEENRKLAAEKGLAVLRQNQGATAKIVSWSVSQLVS